MDELPDCGERVARRGDQTLLGDQLHRGQVVDVVADIGQLRELEPFLLQQRKHVLALVLNAQIEALDGELLRAALDTRRALARDERGLDSSSPQPLDAHPVTHVEALVGFAGRAVVDAAVGEHAVDVGQ